MQEKKEHKFETGFLSSDQGLKLFYRAKEAPNQRAAVVLVHGFAEHSGRYCHLINILQSSGYSCLALDLRGHGRSEGKRGYIDSFDDYLSDIDVAVKAAKSRFQVDSVFMIAHSLGGLLGSFFVGENRNNVRGLVLSSPAFGMNMHIPRWKSEVGKLLSKLAPGFSFPSTIKSNHLSKDAALCSFYDLDPLIIRHVCARLYTEVLDRYEHAAKIAAKISIPLFMQLSDNDLVVCIKKSERFFYNIKIDDRDIKKYQGFLHEIYNETNKEQPIADLIEWLQLRS